MNIRMLGPTNIQMQSMTVNGRSYSAGAGQPIDVPDFDAGVLEANGWPRVAPSGTTSARPTGTNGLYGLRPGLEFYDTTLGALIRYDGATWRNPSSGAAV